MSTYEMGKKRSHSRLQKPEPEELVQIFWNAPASAFFSDEVVSAVISRTRKTLQCDRWRGTGIPYRKCAGRVLYQKSDVISWLESFHLVCSTSEFKQEVPNVT